MPPKIEKKVVKVYDDDAATTTDFRGYWIRPIKQVEIEIWTWTFSDGTVWGMEIWPS